MIVYTSDMLKILDALKENEKFHTMRDAMNSALHLAKLTRYSPLTFETIAARQRLEGILKDSGAKPEGEE